MKASHFNFHKSLRSDFWYVQCRQDLIQRILENHIFNKKLKKSKKKLKKSYTKLLDVGCGIGMNYKALKQFGTVYNIDLDEIAINAYKRKGIKYVFKGDSQDMRMFKSNFFDVVCAIELIEHLPKDYLFVKEAHRVLKKRGFLLLTTPTLKFLWSEDDIMAHHYRRYNLKSLKSLLNKKFKIRLLSYRYFFLFPFSLIVFLMTRLKKVLTKKSTPSLAFTPMLLNPFLKKVMILENSLISKNIKLPFGVGFVVLCEKR